MWASKRSFRTPPTTISSTGTNSESFFCRQSFVSTPTNGSVKKIGAFEWRCRMTTKELKVQRFSITSSKGFHDIVAAIEAVVGHPDMRVFARNLRAANTSPEMEQVVREATGPS